MLLFALNNYFTKFVQYLSELLNSSDFVHEPLCCLWVSEIDNCSRNTVPPSGPGFAILVLGKVAGLLGGGEARAQLVHEGVNPHGDPEAHRLQVGDHFCRVGELTRGKHQLAVARLPVVVNLDLAVVVAVVDDFCCEVHHNGLIDITLVPK